MGTSKTGSSGQRPNKTILSRTLILMLVCGIVAFIILGAQLYKVMITQHDMYEQKAVEQQTRETTVPANRGTICDANGNVLAMSATAYTVFISPYEMEHYGESADYVAKGLSDILGVDYDSVIEKSKDTKSWYKTVATKVESDIADEVREFKNQFVKYDETGKEEYKGLRSVHIENDSKRYYPYGNLACHVIGFVGSDNYGLDGIELMYDDYLKGVDGSVVRLTASNGVDLLYENYENYNDAVDGGNVKLTLDVTVQNIAEKYLEQAVSDNYAQNGGCCIVMNVKTGEILAMACANDYDLNEPFALSNEKLEEIEAIEDETEKSEAKANAQRAQWRNMAISDTYEPGSVFKIITMAMALEEGKADPNNSSYYCGGSMTGIPGREIPLNCWKHAGHGMQTLKEAAQHSCNVAFVNIGLAVGAERFYDYVEAFGLWDKTGIDLAGETGTRSLWWSEKVFKDPRNQSQLAAASFGQTANVTPIQMVTAVSAAVNGGYLMEPYIVSEITGADGKVLYTKEPTVVRQVISEQTSKTVCEILEAVVGEPEGTGKNAYVAGYRVGGKTGTTTKTAIEAKTGIKQYMVSFCGVAPTDDPEIAVLVVLDNPQPPNGSIYISGGVMAAPAVGNIMREVLPYVGIVPQYSDEEYAMLDINMPKVVGYSVLDATAKIEERGLTAKIVGEGDTVTAQLPTANCEIAAGSSVIIYAGGEQNTGEVRVPNLKGLSVNSARSALASVGLFLDTSGAAPVNSSIVVSKQSTEAGEYVSYGSIVEVTLVDSSNLGQY